MTVQALNDRFRRSMSAALGRVMLTRGVAHQTPETVAEVLRLVRDFNEFNEDNDPYEEHDMGRFEVFGQAYYWKIDYYDREMQNGSEDPSDPLKTMRVLTVMLVEEY